MYLVQTPSSDHRPFDRAHAFRNLGANEERASKRVGSSSLTLTSNSAVKTKGSGKEMVDMEIKGVRPSTAKALKYLDLWGDQLIGRKHAVPFLGNVEAGRAKSKDDPHPNEFVFIQVERCLEALRAKEDPERPVVFDLAYHLFVDKKGYRTFKHPHLVGQRQILRLRTRIVESLRVQMTRQLEIDGVELPWELTVPEKRALAVKKGERLIDGVDALPMLVLARKLEEKRNEEMALAMKERIAWLRKKRLKPQTAYSFLGSNKRK